MDWLREAADGSLVLSLHVQPAAKKTEFVGPHGDAMKLRLAAPPVDGNANAALTVFLAAFCGVGRSAVSLVSGETSRAKRVRIEGAGSEALARLRALG
ncbi:DUF167 family protein [Azoarcus sp. PA01]|nr:DUF167 family protein [Azoarcus sp. PA01]